MRRGWPALCYLSRPPGCPPGACSVAAVGRRLATGTCDRPICRRRTRTESAPTALNTRASRRIARIIINHGTTVLCTKYETRESLCVQPIFHLLRRNRAKQRQNDSQFVRLTRLRFARDLWRFTNVLWFVLIWFSIASGEAAFYEHAQWMDALQILKFFLKVSSSQYISSWSGMDS